MNHQFTRTHPFCCSPVEGFYRYLLHVSIVRSLRSLLLPACCYSFLASVARARAWRARAASRPVVGAACLLDFLQYRPPPLLQSPLYPAPPRSAPSASAPEARVGLGYREWRPLPSRTLVD
jgi:hypothetical protein